MDETANIALAAKRIVFGKLLNAGQTCVAPDYVYVHNTVKESLIYHMKQYLSDFLGSYPLDNQNYPKIIKTFSPPYGFDGRSGNHNGRCR